MKSYSFNYIITIHNKQDLIGDVIGAILKVAGSRSKIYAVLDGCTDNSEAVVDEIASSSNVPIIKLYANDVHEILSLNTALSIITQNGLGFNILLQDDVILNQLQFESEIINLYEYLGYYKVGVVGLRHGVDVYLDHKDQELKETRLIETTSNRSQAKNILNPGYVVQKMVGVRSPECLSFHVVNTVGIMDPVLAPYTYDNHDYSLRCILNGFKNYVFGINFLSEKNWGGMRVNPHPEVSKVMARNRKYLYNKYKETFANIENLSKISLNVTKVPDLHNSLVSDKNSSTNMFKKLLSGVLGRLTSARLQINVFTDGLLYKSDTKRYLDKWENSLHDTGKYYLKAFYFFNHSLPPFLKRHKDYYKLERRGFGEDTFHVMWMMLYQRFQFTSFLEIGVYRGQVMSLLSLLANSAGTKLDIVGITPLDKSGDEVSNYLDIDYLADIKTNFAHFSLDMPEILNAYSTSPEAIKIIESKKWDCIYIDGSHDYDIVLKDWEICSQNVRDGGIIVIDDASLYTNYENPSFGFKGHPGPSKVANNIDPSLFTEILRMGHNRVFRKKSLV